MVDEYKPKIGDRVRWRESKGHFSSVERSGLVVDVSAKGTLKIKSGEKTEVMRRGKYGYRNWLRLETKEERAELIWLMKWRDLRLIRFEKSSGTAVVDRRRLDVAGVRELIAGLETAATLLEAKP